MHRTLGFIMLVLAPLVAVLVDQASAQQPARPAGFFITSNASGTGDVGGLAGADKILSNRSCRFLHDGHEVGAARFGSRVPHGHGRRPSQRGRRANVS